jgi:hypothetical protein
LISRRTVNRDRQALRRFVHGHDNAGLRGREAAEQDGDSGNGNGKTRHRELSRGRVAASSWQELLNFG